MKLLNPGPVTTTQRVRDALLSDDLCHREIEFDQLLRRVISKLEAIYPNDDAYRAVLLTGSGTCAVEAMLASCVSSNDHVLLVANGVYGYRMHDILTRYGKSVTLLDFGLVGEIDCNRVEEELTSAKFTQVALVHHETTIGRLNNLDAMGALCKRHQVGMLVDGVSSFAAENIDFRNDALIAVAATANKCLHGFPGMSFVLVNERYLATTEGNSASLYMDLFNHHKAQKTGKVAFTPAVQVLFALDAAIDEFNELGGQPGRLAHYTKLSSRLRDGLTQAGIVLVVPKAECASMLTAFELPPNLTFELLHQHYKENGFVIYPGQRELYDGIFRMATMGDLSVDDIDEIVGLMAILENTQNVQLIKMV